MYACIMSDNPYARILYYLTYIYIILVFGGGRLCPFNNTVEPRLSDSRLSVPSIIWNGMSRNLKLFVEHVINRLLFNKAKSKQTCLIVSRQGLTIETSRQIDLIRLSQCC